MYTTKELEILHPVNTNDSSPITTCALRTPLFLPLPLSLSLSLDSLLPPEGDHDIPVFEEVPDGQFVDATPLKPPYRCDAVTQYFWGRAVDVQKV